MINPQKYLIASACLCGFKCRYDGKSKPNKKIIDLMSKGKLLPICPEVMAGLQTPRPATSVNSSGRIIENETRKNVTKIYNQGAQIAFKICDALKARKAFLKKGSPTCGKNGCFARLLINNGLPVSFTDTDQK